MGRSGSRASAVTRPCLKAGGQWPLHLECHQVPCPRLSGPPNYPPPSPSLAPPTSAAAASPHRCREAPTLSFPRGNSSEPLLRPLHTADRATEQGLSASCMEVPASLDMLQKGSFSAPAPQGVPGVVHGAHLAANALHSLWGRGGLPPRWGCRGAWGEAGLMGLVGLEPTATTLSPHAREGTAPRCHCPGCLATPSVVLTETDVLCPGRSALRPLAPVGRLRGVTAHHPEEQRWGHSRAS